MYTQDNIIYIEKNSLRYNDNILKIPNISRMYIATFRNIKQEEYNEEWERYTYSRQSHERFEKWKKTHRLIRCILLTVFFILACTVSFYFGEKVAALRYVGLLFIVGACICIVLAVVFAKKDIHYKEKPPAPGEFPDTHGLFIEMNSGNSVVFTAVDEKGREALRQLLEWINEADAQGKPIVFNMIDNHIDVKKNDGIINLGDKTRNTVNRGEGHEYKSKG